MPRWTEDGGEIATWRRLALYDGGNEGLHVRKNGIRGGRPHRQRRRAVAAMTVWAIRGTVIVLVTAVVGLVEGDPLARAREFDDRVNEAAEMDREREDRHPHNGHE